jgi:hypothetical protein
MNNRVILVLLLATAWLLPQVRLQAQPSDMQTGDAVPRDVRDMYDRGLKYLVSTQDPSGTWSRGGESGPGSTGLAVMAFLASGEDPNFGPYSGVIRKALRSIIAAQNKDTGYIGSSMYHHGFAMLALAEAYGAVDDRLLWEGSEGTKSKQRSLGEALELAVRTSITSQKKNPFHAWRYSPDARDADTSVSGAVLMGLLAARNAGIEVPDEAIDQALSYFSSMTSTSGSVGYSGGFGGFEESLARSSICTLVFAIGKRKDEKPYRATLTYISNSLDSTNNAWPEYTRYYQAQALFQGDVTAWRKWNTKTIRELKALQQSDGSFSGQMGPGIGTSMALLALALNYRFLPIYER